MAITLDEPPPRGSLPSQSSVDSREPARRRIAYILLLFLGAVELAALVVMFNGSISEQRATNIIGLVFGPIVGLVGTVVGFYFGAQTAIQSAADVVSSTSSTTSS